MDYGMESRLASVLERITDAETAEVVKAAIAELERRRDEINTVRNLSLSRRINAAQARRRARGGY